jgi:hypothetical protein
METLFHSIPLPPGEENGALVASRHRGTASGALLPEVAGYGEVDERDVACEPATLTSATF